jgi:hypothetical protein
MTEACEEVVLDNPESKDCCARGRIVAARGIASTSQGLGPSSIDHVFLRRLGCGSGVGYGCRQASSGAHRLAFALGVLESAAILGELKVSYSDAIVSIHFPIVESSYIVRFHHGRLVLLC